MSIGCKKNLEITNGHLRYSTSTITTNNRLVLDGVMANFKCKSHYVLKGPTQRICKVNENEGQWQGSAPLCEKGIMVIS